MTLFHGEWFCIGMRADNALSGELAGPFDNEPAAVAWSDKPRAAAGNVPRSESWLVFCVTHRGD